MDDIEYSEEQKEELRKRQSDLIRLLDALEKLDKTKEWATLKELIFDKSLQIIERQLLREALSRELKTDKLYHLQGEWAWAKQFCDIDRFASTLKSELANIKLRLK